MMFHLKYTASKTFLTWEELGCLCRALGFPDNLIRRNLDPGSCDVKFSQRGLDVKTVHLMLDLKLLYDSLHLTYNMHTADWNSRAMIKAMSMLCHRALDFDGVYNVRVAYTTYEHMDQKGMTLDKQTLLRALKMCRRAIAPLKLMRKIKHTKKNFEEKGRIQLHEFFSLILWCDLYTEYCHDDTQTNLGQDGDLFKLADFPALLSHHDQRLSKKLNAEYLRDEMACESEEFGSKKMFEDSTINMKLRREQIQGQKDNYCLLRNEINQSQKRVHSAQAGNIRSRPISAPDVERYRREKKHDDTRETSTLEAFETIQRRLRSATSRASTTTTEATPCSERPHIQKDARVPTPRAITRRDLDDMQAKMDDVQFDMCTLNTRYGIQVENKMMFYIPEYFEKLSRQIPETVKTQSPKSDMAQLHRLGQRPWSQTYAHPNHDFTNTKHDDAIRLLRRQMTSRPRPS